MMQVSETARHQRAYEIKRECRSFVAAQQELRIGCPRLRGEFRAVHKVAAKAW